jgi:predicted kinase
MSLNIKNLKEPWVMILIGVPMSGKDFFINNTPNLGNPIVISRDQIVLDVHGSDDYNLAFKSVNQKVVDANLHKSLTDAGKSTENVIVNMTHMTRKRRIQNLSYFPNHNKIAVIFPILTEDEYKFRNLKRGSEENKTIPMHVLKNMLSSYQTVDKNSEGFDKVISL